MDDKIVEEIKENLLAQRATIVEALAAQTDDMKGLVKPIESGDDADIASDAVDRALLDSLGAKDAERIRLIDSALDRIRLGKYGICISCGCEIPPARLKAIPYATMCVNCASAAERKRH